MLLEGISRLSTDDTDEHRKIEALKEPCTSQVRGSWSGCLALILSTDDTDYHRFFLAHLASFFVFLALQSALCDT